MIRTDTAIIGAGHAGLAVSAGLSAIGVDHLVLERGVVGARWVAERWPSLRMLTPNWMNRLPGVDGHVGRDRQFMTRDDFVESLNRCAAAIRAPVLSNTSVARLSSHAGGYLLDAACGPVLARSVVIATGACDHPAVPAWASTLDHGVTQLTTATYRGVDSLSRGGVLVIGASASGVQLAAELHASGRAVTLATGRHVRTPRHYRGRDIMEWLVESGFLGQSRPSDADAGKLLKQPSLQLIGSDDARDITLHALVAQGVRVVGRTAIGHGRRIKILPTLEHECIEAERRRAVLLDAIDDHILGARINAPHPGPMRSPAPPLVDRVFEIDLLREGIQTILWATGFRRSYSWLHVPVLDHAGEIVSAGGATPLPGLFVMGLPFMRTRASSFVWGAVQDAQALVPSIAAHLCARVSRAA